MYPSDKTRSVLAFNYVVLSFFWVSPSSSTTSPSHTTQTKPTRQHQSPPVPSLLFALPGLLGLLLRPLLLLCVHVTGGVSVNERATLRDGSRNHPDKALVLAFFSRFFSRFFSFLRRFRARSLSSELDEEEEEELPLLLLESLSLSSRRRSARARVCVVLYPCMGSVGICDLDGCTWKTARHSWHALLLFFFLSLSLSFSFPPLAPGAPPV